MRKALSIEAAARRIPEAWKGGPEDMEAAVEDLEAALRSPKSDLTAGEKRMLAGLTIMAVRKERRRISKRHSAFVPEPGKRDAALHKVESMERILAKLGGWR